MSSIKNITLEEEMKKNPKLQMSDIQVLREWCEKQPHLPRIQNVQFAIFLHNNNYKIELIKRKIENYYTFRTHLPEFFSNRDLFKVKELQEQSKVMAQLILEKKTKEGYTIVVVRLLDFEPSHYVFNDAVKFGLMMYDESLWTQGSTRGHICVIDASGVTLGHVGRLNLTSFKKFANYAQNAHPIRLFGIHIINLSPIAEIAYNMIKPLVKEKFIKIIHFHSSLDSVKEYFPIEALPNELGGKAGTIKELMDAQIKKIENFHEWYMEDEKINRIDESRRIGKSKTPNDLFGLDGSFKKLDID